MVQRLEAQLAERLGAKHVLFVANGTLALQLAIRALGVDGKAVTTPFSYGATTSALLWERCTPVFADIEERTFSSIPLGSKQQFAPVRARSSRLTFTVTCATSTR